MRHHPARKRADFPRVLTAVNRQPTGSGGKAELTRAATPVVRPSPIFGRRLCRSTVQVDPKANGATASRKGCRGPAELRPIVSRRGVVQCLSCMRRNGARAVLRGGGAGDSTSLPDYPKAMACQRAWPARTAARKVDTPAAGLRWAASSLARLRRPMAESSATAAYSSGAQTSASSWAKSSGLLTSKG